MIRLTRDQPVVLPAPRSAPFTAWIVPGKPGTGLEIDERVATYADLPTGLGSNDRTTVLVTGDGLLYTWDGTSWPAQGDGIEVQGETGPQGRGIAGVSASGNSLVFAMTDSTTETATVPALVDASNSAAAAQAAAVASAGYRDQAAGHAGDAGASADAAAGYADDAAASAQEAADTVAAGVPDATTTVKGGIILAGDLAGTYDAPTVPGLDNKVDKVGTAARLYGTGAANVQTTLAYTSSAATASSIAQRGAAGVLIVGTPTAATHATTKAYVDAADASITSALTGKADLSGGKLVTSQVPDIAVVDYLGTVATQTAMLALTGQKGDWCIRSDLGTVWIITGNDPTVVTGWQQVAYPAAPVSSVAGKTGTVTLTAGDIASGTFSIDRIPLGTTASTVTVGNDARLSNTRTPTDGTVTTAKIVDANVTTAKIADGNVTLAKLATAVQTSLGKADTAVQGNGLSLVIQSGAPSGAPSTRVTVRTA